MIKLNPNALAFWAVSAGVGYLIAGGRGAIWGFVISGGISLLLNFIPD